MKASLSAICIVLALCVTSTDADAQMPLGGTNWAANPDGMAFQTPFYPPPGTYFVPAGPVSVQPPGMVTQPMRLPSQQVFPVNYQEDPMAGALEAPATEPEVLSANGEAAVAGGDCSTCGKDDRRKGRAGSFFAGADFLFVTPHFSDARAFTRLSTGTPDGQGVTRNPHTDIMFHHDYEPSFRVFGGYFVGQCGSELRFTYTRLRGDAEVAAAPALNAFGDPTALLIYDLNVANAGEEMTARNAASGDVYDIAFSRYLSFGGDCSNCAPWSLRWMAGARIANMQYDTHIAETRPIRGDGWVDVTMDFIGAGPLVGLEGRRYLGDRQRLSLYGLWDMAVLFGQFDHQISETLITGGGTTITSVSANAARLIPTTQIEVGVTWQPAHRISISAGWFFQVWWDLGLEASETNPAFTYFRDDSNIQAWEGLTTRVEYCF